MREIWSKLRIQYEKDINWHHCDVARTNLYHISHVAVWFFY